MSNKLSPQQTVAVLAALIALAAVMAAYEVSYAEGVVSAVVAGTFALLRGD